MVFRPSGIHGKAAAFALFLFFGIVGGQVRGNDLPGLSLIGAFMDELASEVDRRVIEWVLCYGRVPVET